MKALISPNETVSYISEWIFVDGSYIPVKNVIGTRIAGVTVTEFDVANPLFWIDCDEDTTSSNHYYDEKEKKIKVIPAPPPQSIDK